MQKQQRAPPAPGWGLEAGGWGLGSPSPYRRAASELQVRKRVSVFEFFSLCLSRACLGKTIMFSIKWHRKKAAFSYRPAYAAQRINALPTSRYSIRVTAPLPTSTHWRRCPVYAFQDPKQRCAAAVQPRCKQIPQHTVPYHCDTTATS
jgi:hypothetical protein